MEQATVGRKDGRGRAGIRAGRGTGMGAGEAFGLLLALLMVVVVISACTAMPGRRTPQSGLNPEHERFYQGREGVVARFDQVPTKLYYYNNPGHAGNQFEVGVDIRNDGASFTRGATFLSGYDPNLLRFEEIRITPGALGACGLSLGSLGFGQWAGIFHCEGFEIGGTSGGNFFFDVRSMRSFVQALGSKFNKQWWQSDKFDFQVQGESLGDFTRFNLNLVDPNFDVEYMNHGRLLIALFSGINFESHHGVEYLLAGDTYEYPGGETDYTSYHGQILQTGWPPGLDQVKQSLLLTNCYFYTTYAAPLVCIDPDPLSDNIKVCSPGQHTWANSQGAPVAITSIEQENTPREAIFRIQIQNIGSGDVWDPGELQKCSPYYTERVRPEDKNVVYVGDIRIGRDRLVDCVPDGIVRLQNGKGTITCKYPFQYTNIRTAYETPLVVELWYGYSTSERRDILVKRMS